jgi:hypothetical protein
MISGKGEFLSPCVPSLVLGIRTPKLPLLPVWEKGQGVLQVQVFWGGACVPSLVLGIRTPKLPLLPVWEKGAGGMRGKSIFARFVRLCARVSGRWAYCFRSRGHTRMLETNTGLAYNHGLPRRYASRR